MIRRRISSSTIQRYTGRRLRVESLEPRLLLAGDTYLINFQLADVAVPTRYLADTGQLFGDRGNGLTYGWLSDHTDVSRDRGLNADQRLDTLIHFHEGQNWSIMLPNGQYEVTVAVGDPANNDGVHTVNVEGVNFWNAVPDGNDALVMTKQVTLADGKLTVDQGAAAEKATRINYIHVVGLPSGPNAAPAMPSITEPSFDGQVVHPGDAHMESTGYFDPDGNSHKSTDWEIWTIGPGAAPVWQTLGIAGVERLHIHLGDGIFINSRAGQNDLAPNTDHELRVRFRDDAGSVSASASRAFHTGIASSIVPMEFQDVASFPAPEWTTSVASNAILPAASPIQSQLHVASAMGQLMLSISGDNGITNMVTNPAALVGHANARIAIIAGSSGLALGETKLTLRDEDNLKRTIFLPAFILPAGQRLDLWVAVDGSTYYGTAAQTAPDFSNLARMAVGLPFMLLQPDFEIDVVAEGLRLPVNIAFVPNPGPDPDDPLYYVSELYGSIQVVRRDGTRQTFASGLLDYNPQGPISGTGEQGLTGIAVQRDAVNPDIYHLYVGMLWDNGAPPGNLTHYPKVERLDSTAGGLTMASRTVLLNMQPETQGQSHQISNITVGPDGKLYVHNGDGFDFTTAQNLDSYRGKILRMNLDGSAPSDNPFYNAADGVNARDYVFAYGLRNPFGGAWRAADGKHYEVENGPSVDRMAQINRGVNYGWNNTNASMTINAIYNWNPAHAPVNIDFVQSATFGGSRFPAAKQDHAFVSESGPTYAAGPQTRGKRIVEFVLDASGNRLSGPITLVEYVGTGRATVVGLAAGPDGLYFSELYEDSGASGATAAGARIFRVRYVNPLAGDYDINGVVNQNDYAVWRANFGSNILAAADGNGNGVVDTADYVVWRDNLGATLAAAALTADSAVGTSTIDVSPTLSPPFDVFALPEAPVSGAEATQSRVTARNVLAHDWNDIRDAALLAVLDAGKPTETQSDPANLPATIESSDVDPFESIDELFAALTLL